MFLGTNDFNTKKNFLVRSNPRMQRILIIVAESNGPVIYPMLVVQYVILYHSIFCLSYEEK
jgi:hypothetical protein